MGWKFELKVLFHTFAFLAIVVLIVCLFIFGVGFLFDLQMAVQK